MKQLPFLPISRKEMQLLGWVECDIIIVSGDAYIDHPSFAPAILGRYLQNLGYKVGIIAQPDWTREDDFTVLGKPRLCFGVTAGNMDSMINHYTAQKKRRSDDAYSPDGVIGKRPDRATLVYTTRLKAIYKDTPIVLGGIEASLRRLPHYDYWSDKVRNSILFDSKADILVYGMGERPMREIVKKLDEGIPASGLNNIRGTVVVVSEKSDSDSYELPEYPDCIEKNRFLEMHQQFEKNYRTKVLYQTYAHRFLRHNPPSEPLSEKEMDEVYNLYFSRKPHPSYGNATFKAFEQIKESVTSHRGCFGGCSFCAIGSHQGKTISSRSEDSILREIQEITRHNYFKGTITDIGGPSANMYKMSCRAGISQTCLRISCLFPSICPNLNYSHKANRELLEAALLIPKVKHVFVASGIRFDLAMNDRKYIRQISEIHTGGHLKLAPEHVVDSVLKLMQKPSSKTYLQFCEKFETVSKEIGKNQKIVPYLIVGHPGTSLSDAVDLALFLKRNHILPEQIQEFTPTPMAISTTMYYTERDFFSGKRLHIPRGREVRLQKALAQWFIPENRRLVKEALERAGRMSAENELFGAKEKNYSDKAGKPTHVAHTHKRSSEKPGRRNKSRR